MPRITVSIQSMHLASACFIGLLAVFISACTSRYSVFVNNYEHEVEQTNKVVLIHDATILSAISRHNFVIHQERSIEALKWVNHSITDIVTEKDSKSQTELFGQ